MVLLCSRKYRKATKYEIFGHFAGFTPVPKSIVFAQANKVLYNKSLKFNLLNLTMVLLCSRKYRKATK